MKIDYTSKISCGCGKSTDSFDRYVECFRDILDPEKEFLKEQINSAYVIAKQVVQQIERDAGGADFSHEKGSLHRIQRDFEGGRITHLISMGCGTGEELLYIAALCPHLKLIGIDASDVSKRQAVKWKLNPTDLKLDVLAKRCGKTSGQLKENIIKADIEFRYGALDELSKLVSESSAPPPESSMLLFLGHTYTMIIKQNELYTILNKWQPKFLFVDFHENWDDAIKCVRKEGAPIHFEPRLCLDAHKIRLCRNSKASPQPECGLVGSTPNEEASPILFGLTTAAKKGEEGTKLVQRGLAASWCNDSLHFSLPTDQVCQTKDELLLELSQQCKYLPVGGYSYHCGYGHMEATLLWRISEDEEIGREALYETLAGKTLPALLLKDDRPVPFLNSTREFFDGYLFAALLGSDPFMTFASYCQLEPRQEGVKSEDICSQCKQSPPQKNILFSKSIPDRVSKLLDHLSDITTKSNYNFPYLAANTYMVVQPFSHTQSLLPTADGTYYCALHSPAGICVMPPSAEKCDLMLPVDIAFANNKTGPEALAAAMNATLMLGKEVSSTETRSNRWISLMVYYGSLPICFLFLRPCKSLSKHDDDFDVGKSFWQAYAGELQRLVHRMLIAELHVLFIIPFCANILRKLSEANGGAPDQARCERIALGTIVHSIRKPWKSWIAAFPERDIKSLDRCQMENKNILDELDKYLAFLRASDRTKVSLFLRNCDFFSPAKPKDSKNCGDPHDEVAAEHFYRLAKACGIADNNEDLTTLKGQCADKKTLEPFASKLRGRMTEWGIPSVFVDWCCLRISLMDFIPTGPEYNTKTNEAYSELKALFCRNLANSGPYYRYDGIALLGMLNIKLGVAWKKFNCDGVTRGNSNKKDFYRPVCEDDDGVEFIAETLREALTTIFAINNMTFEKDIESIRLEEVEKEKWDSPRFSIDCTLTVTFKTRLTYGFGRGGQDEEVYKKLVALGIPKHDDIFKNKMFLKVKYCVEGPRNNGKAITIDRMLFVSAYSGD